MKCNEYKLMIETILMIKNIELTNSISILRKSLVCNNVKNIEDSALLLQIHKDLNKLEESLINNNLQNLPINETISEYRVLLSLYE